MKEALEARVRNLLLSMTWRQSTGTRTNSQNIVWPLMSSIVRATSVLSHGWHGSQYTSFIVVVVVLVEVIVI